METSQRLIFLDTDVVIDVQRRVPSAVEWVTHQATLRVSIPSAVAAELLIGSRNRAELTHNQRATESFYVVPLSSLDSELWLSLIGKYHLSTGLGMADFLIAAQALNHQAILYSFNLKHFGAIEGLDVRRPYER